jgi:hypothetical protein
LSIANAIEEEVAQEEEVLVAVVVDDGKVACDICGKRYKVNVLNTHKAVLFSFLCFRHFCTFF